MKHFSTLVLGATLLTVAACGNKNDSSSKRKALPVAPEVKSPLVAEEGYFEATLAPLNSHLAGDVEGKAQVTIKGNDVSVEVKINGAPASIKHAQYIHVSDSCPTLSSDENKDGVIDAAEGMKSYGPAVIPLDSNLSTQKELDSAFPAADFSGNYYYKQVVSMAEMMMDLTAKDNDLSDNIVKIDSSLSLAGRQVVIYGVADDAAVPESVSSLNGQTKHASLPIACGSFVKMTAPEEGSTSTGGKE